MADKRTMKLTLMRGTGGRLLSHQACVRGLGLRRMHQVVEIEDTPATRGMVNKVSYMVEILEESPNAPE